jgi:spore coat polysaccharide biosynthesis predicted glycosyltransferase SpsG
VELKDWQTDVIIGSANPCGDEILKQCEGIAEVQLYVQVENMAERIALADFALGAGGVAMWERCFLGLPAAVAVVADNQAESVDIATRSGAVWSLGCHLNTTSDSYEDILVKAMTSPEDLNEMGSKAIGLMESSTLSKLSPVIESMLMME